MGWTSRKVCIDACKRGTKGVRAVCSRWGQRPTSLQRQEGLNYDYKSLVLDLPSGRKVTGTQRAQIEVFRGALRPFTTTVNQELSDVLKSQIRLFTVFSGSVTGAAPCDQKIADALDFLVSDGAVSSSEVIFCVDESR